MKKFDNKIMIPDFVFTDGSVGPFNGYEGISFPMDLPRKWVWEMGLVDNKGNCFTIEIDTRKKSRTKHATIFINNEAFFHPILTIRTVWGNIDSKGYLVPFARFCEDWLSLGSNTSARDKMIVINIIAEYFRTNAEYLKEKNVSRLDPLSLFLRCDDCGEQWSAVSPTDGKLKIDYWKCPRGCNSRCADLKKGATVAGGGT